MASAPHNQPPGERVLGFDYGEWRIGVAVGDRRLESGRPLTTLHNRNADQIDWGAVEALIAEWQPDLVVLGWPVNDLGGVTRWPPPYADSAIACASAPACPCTWRTNG